MTASIRRSSFIASCAVVGLSLTSLGGGTAFAAATQVDLGTASSYAVLAGTTVTNTGPSTVQGDLGVNPGAAVTGFPPGQVSAGVIHAADAAAASAQADLVTAYNATAAQPSTDSIAADLAGLTLTTGVYTGGALSLSGNLTLDAQGDPDAVFVFQAASTLLLAGSSTVSMVNGAQSCNVFWQVGSSATIGTNAQFVGTVLALTSIAAQTNASIDGRLLARNGAVTLDSNTFTRSSCQAGPTTSTSDNGSTATTAPGSGTPTQLPDSGSHTTPTLIVALLAVLVGTAAVIGVRRTPRRHEHAS
jgi:hypothetical protein